MMKKVLHVFLACVGVLAFWVTLMVFIPRHAFVLLALPTIAATGYAFAIEKRRAIALAATGVLAAAIAITRIDVMIVEQSASPKGVYFERAVWGRAPASPGVYLAGCEPPAFEPLHILVIRL